MIRLGSSILFLFFASLCFAQDLPLIRFKDHHFWIQNGSLKVELPSNLEYVFPFRSPHQTVFIQNGQKGILSHTGKILKPAQNKDIYPLHEDYFYFMSDSNYVQNVSDSLYYLGKYKEHNSSWVVLNKGNGVYALNYKSKKEVKISDFENPQIHENYITYIQEDSTSKQLHLIDSKGQDYVTTDFIEHDLCLIVKKPNKTIVLVQQFKTYEFDNSTRVATENDISFGLSVTKNGRTQLLNVFTNQVILEMEADLLITSYPYIKVRRGNKWGLVDLEGNWILDCKFDEVNANLDFAWGSTKKRTGEILRLSDRKKFAFPYDYIYSLGSFYQVRLGDLNGVIDSTNFKEILPPMFSLVSAEDTLIIGQNTTFQRRIGLDSSRQVIYDLTVPKFREYNTLSNIGHDKRLDAQGWFFEEKERFDKDGFLIDKKKYYGLQNDTGKVIRKPYFTYPRYLANRDYILYFAGIQLRKEGQKEIKTNYYHLAYSRNGAVNIEQKIWAIQTADVYNKGYIRFLSESNHGIIDMDGKYKLFDFLQYDNVDYPRVCFGSKGKDFTKKKSKTSFNYFESLFPDLPEKITEKTDARYPDFLDAKDWYEFEKGKWNFLDQDGSYLFDEDFEFVYPFHLGRSIVKQKGRWGVVSDTGFVIPPIYHDVENYYASTDDMQDAGEQAGFYIVTKVDYKPILRDINFRELKIDFDRVVSKDEDLLLVEKNGRSFLLNEELDLLDEDAVKTTFIGNGMYFQKEEKEHFVFDLNGNLKCSTSDYRPYKMIFDNYVLCKRKGKYYVFSIEGDSVCQSKSKKFQLTAETAFISDGKKYHILLKDGTVITSKKNLELLADNEGKFYGTVESGKVKIYNTTGSKLFTVKTTSTPYLVNGRLIYKNDQWMVLNLSNGQEESLEEELSEVEVFDQFYHLITFKNKKQKLYDNQWEEIKLNKRYRIKYWEEGSLLLQSQGNYLLYANGELVELPTSWEVIGPSHFGKIIAKENNREFFINQKGELLFGKTFEKCSEFNGDAAAVKSYYGWTLINEKGDYLHFPCFGEIMNATENTFIELQRVTYGIFDQNGNQLLAPIYQKIEWVDKDLISCLLDGQIVYFHFSDLLQNRKSKSLQF